MPGKRGNSEGSIRKRADGRWEARVMMPDGKRKSFYGETRQEVARLLTQALRDREQGVTALNDRQTVAQYLTFWLEQVKHQIDGSSYIRYEVEVRLRLIPEFGKVLLSKLTAQQVQAVYARMLDEGMSAGGVRYMHMVLHRALDAALRLGLVYRNVTEMVNIPRLLRREIAPLTSEQVHTFLEAAGGHRLEALFVLALATGMRRGELLALTWADVDLESAQLQVRSALQQTPEGLIIAQPKTKRSRRTIALAPTVVEALRRHREAQEEERKRVGEAWTDLGLAFPNTVGRCFEPRSMVYRYFKPLVRVAGLPGTTRFHDLRHTAATLLLMAGVNVKVVSEMLGHASITITLDIYGHVLPHMQEQAAQIMEGLLWGPRAGWGQSRGQESPVGVPTVPAR
jgi:integrase